MNARQHEVYDTNQNADSEFYDFDDSMQPVQDLIDRFEHCYTTTRPSHSTSFADEEYEGQFVNGYHTQNGTAHDEAVSQFSPAFTRNNYSRTSGSARDPNRASFRSVVDVTTPADDLIRPPSKFGVRLSRHDDVRRASGRHVMTQPATSRFTRSYSLTKEPRSGAAFVRGSALRRTTDAHPDLGRTAKPFDRSRFQPIRVKSHASRRNSTASPNRERFPVTSPKTFDVSELFPPSDYDVTHVATHVYPADDGVGGSGEVNRDERRSLRRTRRRRKSQSGEFTTEQRLREHDLAASTVDDSAVVAVVDDASDENELTPEARIVRSRDGTTHVDVSVDVSGFRPATRPDYKPQRRRIVSFTV